MRTFSISTLRSSFGDARGRIFTVVERQPSLLARLVAAAVAIVLLALFVALFLILLVPIVVIALALAIVATISHTIRRALRNTREPNGILDGRRNVRVVVPERDAR